MIPMDTVAICIAIKYIASFAHFMWASGYFYFKEGLKRQLLSQLQRICRNEAVAARG